MPDSNISCVEAITSDEYIDLLVNYDGDIEGLRRKYQAQCIQIISNLYAVVHIQRSSIADYNIQTFGYNTIPKCYGLMDKTSMEQSGILRLQRQPNLLLRGQGVLVGIIDTGIDYTNTLFRNADGTSRIAALWDQTIESDQRPQGFQFGTEYLTDDINNALNVEDPFQLVPSRDTNGHGTFLSAIAAGGEDVENDFIGAAPDAELVVVKLKEAKNTVKDFFAIPQSSLAFQNTDIMLAVQYLYELANRYRKPLSICLGLGTNQGARDGQGAIDDYLSYIGSRRGISITTAAGNEGLSGHHYFGEVNPQVGYDTVEVKVGREDGFTIELWGNSPGIYSIGIKSPGGEIIERIPARTGESREVNLFLERTNVRIDYRIVENETGDELIIITLRNPTQGIWSFKVFEDDAINGGFHMWLPISNFLSEETFFIRSNPDTTLVTPADARGPITAVAYNHNNNSLYINSSRGFGRGNMIKPDIAAPGVNVYGPNVDGTYGTRSGTSVSAAHVTGAAALMLEWGILKGNATSIDSTEIKKYLIRGAVRNPALTYPSKEWGYGILDIYRAFTRLI